MDGTGDAKEKMTGRVLILGNNSIGVNCIRYLSSQNVDIVAVVPDPDDKGIDDWQKSVRKAAKDLEIPLVEETRLGCAGFLERVKGLSPDFIFSIQCATILGRELIGIPGFGVINLHFSMLPRYRGCYPIAWALINGEKSTGVTLHYVDEGIDTGDIISQQEVCIGESTTGRQLFDECSKAGLDLFIKETGSILRLENARTPQDSRFAIYYSSKSIDFTKNGIDWNTHFIPLYNRIRALIFPPFQYPCTEYNNQKIEITSVISYNNTGVGKEGEITSLDRKGMSVSACGGNIVIDRVRIEGRIEEVGALPEQYGIRKGDILGPESTVN